MKEKKIEIAYQFAQLSELSEEEQTLVKKAKLLPKIPTPTTVTSTWGPLACWRMVASW